MTARVLSVLVLGAPVPQGSKRHVGNGRLVESADVEPWRVAVAVQVRSAMNKTNHPGYARECPLHVLVTFYLAKPPSVRREHPTARPDLDKLVRATLDGLTQSGAIVDDAQVVAITTRKQYAEAGAPSGARLMVMESNPV